MEAKKHKHLIRKLKLIFISFFYYCLCYSQTGIITTVGNGLRNYTCNSSGNGGPVMSASFNIPVGLATDSRGNIFVSDKGTPCVRRIDTNGVITNFAGCGSCQYDSIYCGEGDSAIHARFSGASEIATDCKGNLYITTSTNNVVLKVDSNNILTRFAGTGYGWGSPYGSPFGVPPYSGDNGLAINAELADPDDIAIDPIGNVYIADFANNRVRMVDTNGIITTVAGNGVNGYNGDSALATNAEITVNSVLLDSEGNLYIGGNNIIRKVDANTKIINTVVGNGIQGYSGNNDYATNANLNCSIAGMAFDSFGNLYIADCGNNVIRKVDKSSGIITTIAGNGTQGYSGDNGPAINATFYGLCEIVFDAKGNLYIADALNSVIRRINDAINLTSIDLLKEQSTNIKIYPNPTSNFISLNIEGIPDHRNAIITIQNTLGQSIKKLSFTNNLDVSDLEQGCYFIQVTLAKGETLKTKFIKQ